MRIKIGQISTKERNRVLKWITEMLAKSLDECPIILSEIIIDIEVDC